MNQPSQSSQLVYDPEINAWIVRSVAYFPVAQSDVPEFDAAIRAAHYTEGCAQAFKAAEEARR